MDAARLVVGYDGHDAGRAALGLAIELATRMPADVHVLHSVTLSDYGIDPDIDAYAQECERNLARERQDIADAFSGRAVTWSYHELRGDPAERLTELADELGAAMIVVGASQRHLIHGDNVPKRLLHRQRRPVLVVPSRPAGTPGAEH